MRIVREDRGTASVKRSAEQGTPPLPIPRHPQDHHRTTNQPTTSNGTRTKKFRIWDLGFRIFSLRRPAFGVQVLWAAFTPPAEQTLVPPGAARARITGTGGRASSRAAFRALRGGTKLLNPNC